MKYFFFLFIHILLRTAVASAQLACCLDYINLYTCMCMYV